MERNTPGQLIEEEIRLRGPIPFARFMELALYGPGVGYYEHRRPIGRGGDFFTSVSVGPLFGQLLAYQFAQWMDAGATVRYIEAGPHDGTLAADILAWTSRHRPDLFARLEYFLLDSSPSRRAWQEETLQAWLPKIRWVAGIDSLGAHQTNGIIFSNEFLDALPVHRLAWNAPGHQWREAHVTLQNGEFAWTWNRSPALSGQFMPQVPPDLAAVLPDGFTVEVCPAAAAWWGAAASKLRHGRLLTMDYGLTAPQWFRPECSQGTLRAFSRHHINADLLAKPGEQDLTAHVHFPALREAGEAAGLRTECLAPQSSFLTEILARVHQEPDSFGAWDSKCARQFQTLTHPEQLGHKFHALVQAAP